MREHGRAKAPQWSSGRVLWVGFSQSLLATPSPLPSRPPTTKSKQAGQHDSEHHHPFTPQKLPPAKTLPKGRAGRELLGFSRLPSPNPQKPGLGPKTRFRSQKNPVWAGLRQVPREVPREVGKRLRWAVGGVALLG